MNFTDWMLQQGAVLLTSTEQGLSLFRFPGTERRVEFHPLRATEIPAADIVVWEDVWHRHRKAVQNRLLSFMGKCQRLHGRLCRVQRITKPEAETFLEDWHTAGYTGAAYHFGLFRQKELVAVASFSKSRTLTKREKPLRSCELIQYATKGGYRVAGGLGKLLQFAAEDRRFEHLMTYADLEWTDGAVYRRLGFKEDSHTEPIRFLVHEKTRVRVPAGRQDAVAAGWVKIANRGNIKFVKLV
ncbi:MAG: hypothetical protein JNL57_08085 [Bacteroidetes bacterium]|nr:hypothetical protein [Bacteroidota bacterium]